MRSGLIFALCMVVKPLNVRGGEAECQCGGKSHNISGDGSVVNCGPQLEFSGCRQEVIG